MVVNRSHSPSRERGGGGLLVKPCSNQAILGFQQLAQASRLFRAVRQARVHLPGKLTDGLAHLLQMGGQVLVGKIFDDW